MKNTIIVLVIVVVAGLVATGYALTAGKSVSARIHGETEVNHIQTEPETKGLF